MIDAAYYLLQVTLCSGILYGYYLLALRNEVYHHWNRYYLLATVGLSLLLPAIRIPVRQEAVVAESPAVRVLEVVATGDAYVEYLGRSEALQLSTDQWLLLGYAAVGLGVLFVLLHALWRIRRILRRHPQVELEGCRLVVTRERGTPFSFLRYVFWHADVPLSTEAGQRMLRHELAHVRERHTYDKLLLGAALVPCWGNPFLWLIRREMAMIHEFIADRRSVDGPDGAALAAMLLEASFPGRSHLLTHPFFHSPLKRRLKMILKTRDTRTSYITRILALPLLALVAAAFTLRPAAGPAPLQKKPDAPAFTVVIDAGHGGQDAGVQDPDGRMNEKDLTLAIARRIRDLNRDPSLRIVLLREKDEFQSLKQKVERSLALKPDAFVSIHINGAGPEEGPRSGIEVFLGTRNQGILPASRQLGSLLHSNLSHVYPTLDTLRTRSQGIWVLDAPEIDYPAAIVECGYLTNPKDRAFLSKPANLDALARSILEGIAGYRSQQQTQAQIRLDTIPAGRISVGGVTFRADARTEDLERVLIIVNGEKMDIRDAKGKTIQADTAFYYPKNDPEAVRRYGLEGKNGVLEFRKAVVGVSLPEMAKPSSDTMPAKNAPKRFILVNGKAIGDVSPAELDRLIPPDRIVTMDVIRRLDSMPDHAGPVARDVVIIRTKPTEDSSGFLTRIIPGLPLSKDSFDEVEVRTVPPPKESRKADDPLVIIDGNRIGRMSTAKLDAILAPDRIARIDVLKGETAIAHYGEEGRNGVIVVHSKAYEAARKDGGRKD
jgi:N-acetylmuramoyl-L-alanine amidase